MQWSASGMGTLAEKRQARSADEKQDEGCGLGGRNGRRNRGYNGRWQRIAASRADGRAEGKRKRARAEIERRIHAGRRWCKSGWGLEGRIRRLGSPFFREEGLGIEEQRRRLKNRIVHHFRRRIFGRSWILGHVGKAIAAASTREIGAVREQLFVRGNSYFVARPENIVSAAVRNVGEARRFEPNDLRGAEREAGVVTSDDEIGGHGGLELLGAGDAAGNNRQRIDESLRLAAVVCGKMQKRVVGREGLRRGADGGRDVWPVRPVMQQRKRRADQKD